METMTIQDLAPSVRERIRQRALRHGHSMEAEVREILTQAVATDGEPEGLAQAVKRAFAGVAAHDIPDFTTNRSTPRDISL
ncbi:FitA-like ribbon-helix-helix domain-containing protein [Tessaracoccus caeni]|uniref:FitA-like ribbon-helix-helix domain-containing protein n=1 Tax=Tessaracoccus caeni TaxID=3031239 RepID=UPI0023DC4873|nr:Arc family DNA-binding protein [Tessaracoccus caeni]MDF1487873.1 Arc family DNA-binding protein [Tessaracoccus caeni]